MSFHRNPAYNNPQIRAGLKSHGLPIYEPSQLSDAFREGWVADMDVAEVQRAADTIARDVSVERERCAKVADSVGADNPMTARDVAAEIRNGKPF